MACTYAGQQYGEGSLTCQAGREMKCQNGGWVWTGVMCRAAADEASYERLDKDGKVTATVKTGQTE